jgi:hypothetical protein
MKKTLLFKSIALSLFMLFSIGILNAQVFITEIADPNNGATVRYIELFNAGSSAVDFTEGTGWRIDKYTNASATVSQTLALTGSIPAGGYYLIATGTDDGDFLTMYGVSADQFDGADNDVAGSNGDDNLELYNGSDVLIDQFGVPGEDGTGTNHEFEDGRAERVATVTTGNATWDVAEWTIDSDAPSGDGAVDAPDAFDPREWIGDVTLATDLFFSEYFEGDGGTNKYIEIFNGTGADVDLSGYMLKGSNNGGGWDADRDLALSGTLVDGDVYIVARDAASIQAILDEADLLLAYECPVDFNGDDAIALLKDDGSGTFNVIDIIGDIDVDPGSAWDAAGVTGATANHVLIRKYDVVQGNTDWVASAGTDTDDSEWIVGDANDANNIGFHTFGEAPTSTVIAVTFNVDMSLAESFDPASDIVYIAGTIAGAWTAPGDNAAYALTDTDGNMVYTIVLEIPEAGDIAYKFFLNAGWDGGEWAGDPNRTATITEATTLDHIFGNQGEAIFFDTPFTQNFDYTTAYANVSLAGWTNANLATGGAVLWTGREFSDDKYAQMSSYSSSSTGADEVWLITPGIEMDDSTGEELSFDVNIGYWTHDGLTVKISTDFDQTVAGILTATWTDVTSSFTIPSEPAGDYGTFATAGHLDVSSYAGTMYVAFVYNGDKTTSETTTYQIDNVVIAEAGTVGFDDVLATELNIYPNPSTGRFYIQMGDAFKANTKVEVFNVVGMKVFETLATAYKTEIDLSAMKQGVYYVRVDNGQNIITQKIMKQ